MHTMFFTENAIPIFTAIIALATIAYVIVTWRTLNEIKKERKDRILPYPLPTIKAWHQLSNDKQELIRGPGLDMLRFILIIKNIGEGVSKEINISLDFAEIFDLPKKDYKRRIHALGSGMEEYFSLFDISAKTFENLCISKFNPMAKVRYKDISGNEYSIEEEFEFVRSTSLNEPIVKQVKSEFKKL